MSKFFCLESTEKTEQSRVGPWTFVNSQMVLSSHQSNGFVAALDQTLQMNYVM